MSSKFLRKENPRKIPSLLGGLKIIRESVLKSNRPNLVLSPSLLDWNMYDDWAELCFGYILDDSQKWYIDGPLHPASHIIYSNDCVMETTYSLSNGTTIIKAYQYKGTITVYVTVQYTSSSRN